MKKIYEFLLWNNCSNNCTFCHQRNHERKTDDKILSPEEQIESLNLCKHFLDTEFEQGNHILLVGGEIFDVKNDEVNRALKWLLLRVVEKMSLNEIELLYLNTNLLYKDINILCWLLNMIQDNHLFDRLKFTTSYDIVGRFTSKEREYLFYHNLKYLTDGYPGIHIVVNTVLTNEACKRIQENKFGANYLLEYLQDQNKFNITIKEWEEYFKVQINTIPYIILDYEKSPEAPSEIEVIKTLQHINTIEPGYLKQYTENIALKQEKRLFEYNKNTKKFIYCSSKLGECGHSVNFKKVFKDSDKCFPCELEKLVQIKAY